MKLGTSTFSFTNEWLSGRVSLEQLLTRIGELGPSIELIGYQVWRSFPRLEPDEVLAFRRLVDRLGLEPAALGAYVDLLRRVDRAATNAEAVEELAPQIALAQSLGFPLLRLHAGISAAVLEQTAPIAERAGVTLATEIQGGQTPDDPAVSAVLDARDRTGSPAVALTLDFSVSMGAIPVRFGEAVRRAGLSEEELDRIVALWQRDATTAELFAALEETGAPALALDEARSGLFRFGRQDPKAWLALVPYVAHAHAKFWELDDSGDEPTVRNAELLAVLRDGGYSGVVCSEWGGNAWVEAEDVDAFELTRRHLALLRDLVHKPAAVPAVS